jgi:hypothetical protein
MSACGPVKCMMAPIQTGMIASPKVEPTTNIVVADASLKTVTRLSI